MGPILPGVLTDLYRVQRGGIGNGGSSRESSDKTRTGTGIRGGIRNGGKWRLGLDRGWRGD